MSRFQRRVQTVLVPAGGAVFDVEIDAQGFYPLVSRAFAQGDYGQVGALRVGRPKRTIGH